MKKASNRMTSYKWNYFFAVAGVPIAVSALVLHEPVMAGMALLGSIIHLYIGVQKEREQR